MEYNNYYPVQSGHLPPNQQHGGGPQMQQQQQQQHQQQQQQQQSSQQGGQMMHSPMPQQQIIRQAGLPGPQSHHQQMQQMQSQQHIGHHPQQQQQLPPQHQQQQHPNYHQIQPPHPHGPPVSHSSSPHAQQHHNHNHQPNMHGPLSQQQPMSQHVHPQSPHHHGGPVHMQQQQQQQPPPPSQQQQPLNQMVRPHMGPTVINHPQSGQHQPGHHHQQNFFSGGGPMSQSSVHHYPQNQHHQPQQHHPPPVMHHPPPLSAHHPQLQQGIGRNSPYYANISQTEFRIIELNRRLQCRPLSRHPYNPLPSPYDESIWWERFAADFFEDDATLTLRMLDDKPVEYTIGRTLIPRFFRSYFDGGVTDLSISLRNPKETFIHPHLITLDCDQAFIVTSNIFRHPSIASSQGVVVHTEGHLTLDFVNNQFDNMSIKSWRFYTRGSREFIDRSILNTMGLPNNYLAEPITRQGFTKSTITYLKMCMIMEPMQELMFQHKQTKLDPRSCLRKLLFDRYKFRSGEENRTATNKRRKRKPSVAPAAAGNTATNKKSKAGINNSMGNNVGITNMIMSPSGGPPSFSLASQDVMVVGEPSMMGGDFGDDNERMITRLENTQYDPGASSPTNPEESDSLHAQPPSDVVTARDEIDSGTIDNHSMSPSMIQQHVPQEQLEQQPPSQQQQPQPQPQSQLLPPKQQQQGTVNSSQSPPEQHPQAASQTLSQEERVELPTSQLIDHQVSDGPQEKEQLPLQAEQISGNVSHTDLETISPNQRNLAEPNDEQREQQQQDQPEPNHQVPEVPNQNGDSTQFITHQPQISEEQQDSNAGVELSHQVQDGDVVVPKEESETLKTNAVEETKISSMSTPNTNSTNMINNINSIERTDNHNDSIQQQMNDESNSNSQLPCSTANATTAIEQQQPVDNGVA